MTIEEIKQKAKCCITEKPMSTSKHLNFVQLQYKANWAFPIWGNILTGHAGLAIAYIHDDCKAAKTEEIKFAVQIEGDELIYHRIETLKPATTPNLNLDFFNDIAKSYPDALIKFSDWFTKYKTEVGWDQLFNARFFRSGEVHVPAPKFNDLPFEIQHGLLSRFDHEMFNTKDGNGHFQYLILAKTFRDETINLFADLQKTVDKDKNPAGNDDHLFGLPTNLDEAVETFLEYFRTASDANFIIDASEKEFCAGAHHAAGQFIRNSWFLWWHEGHKYETWPKTKPALNKFFNDLGIVHADDMSGIIITSAYRKVHKIDIDLPGQVKRYQNFWKKQGYKDGIPKQ
jgi:hypothetical protein